MRRKDDFIILRFSLGVLQESPGCRADPLTEALAVLQRKGTEFVGPKPRSVAMMIICVLPDGLHITSLSLITSPDPDDGISR